MKTRVQKWGNSLALRIPKSFAAEAGWGSGRGARVPAATNEFCAEHLMKTRK